MGSENEITYIQICKYCLHSRSIDPGKIPATGICILHTHISVVLCALCHRRAVRRLYSRLFCTLLQKSTPCNCSCIPTCIRPGPSIYITCIQATDKTAVVEEEQSHGKHAHTEPSKLHSIPLLRNPPVPGALFCRRKNKGGLL